MRSWLTIVLWNCCWHNKKDGQQQATDAQNTTAQRR